MHFLFSKYIYLEVLGNYNLMYVQYFMIIIEDLYLLTLRLARTLDGKPADLISFLLILMIHEK